ncbi:MAG: LytTR family DNA-binding domain-containing protein [Pseudomonadota bacterium]
MKETFDIGDVSPRRYFAIVAVVLGLLFAFVAGDDDSGLDLISSLVLWQIQSLIPMLLLLATHMTLSRIAFFERRGTWERLLISGVVGALLFSPFATLFDQFLGGDERPFSLVAIADEAWNITPPITLAWIAINAPFVLGLRLTNTGMPGGIEARGLANGPCGEAGDLPEVSTTKESGGLELAECDDLATAEAPTFMRLVAPKLQGRVLYLQAELHYLAVVTDSGRSLVLYSLRDAVAESAGIDGFWTHRSFWVARSAVHSFRRRGRQGLIRIENGDDVPVSRRRLPELQALLEELVGAKV